MTDAEHIATPGAGKKDHSRATESTNIVACTRAGLTWYVSIISSATTFASRPWDLWPAANVRPWLHQPSAARLACRAAS
jgi:hypothetical protein